MHLDDGYADATDAVGQGDGSVGIGSRIHHHAIKLSVSLLQLVDEAALVVGLVVVQLVLRESRPKRFKIGLERNRAVDFRLAFAQKVEVGSVDNEDSHG